MATDKGDQNENKDLNQANDQDKNGTSTENDSEPTELESKIVAQIEYYFGDINLPRDKFMLEQIKMDDGWIPMSVMLAFQRLAKLTTDPKVIAKALFHSDLMEVDESGSEIKIRRSPEFPIPENDDARRKDLLNRSVYCARFPQETGIDTLLAFFNPYGPVENVLMRKYKDKVSKTRKFKGSVFVTFKTKERGQEFIDLESVKYEDTELTRKWQMDYIAEKKQVVLENKMKRKGLTGRTEEEVETIVKENFPRGATIHLAGEFEGINRESIRDKFTALGFEPAFIEFKVGETQAHVRLSEENAGKTFLEKFGPEVEITNSKLTARLLEGEEEKKFLETAAITRSAAFKRRQSQRKGGRKGKKGKGNRGGGGGGGGGREGGRKRRGSPVSGDAPPVKKAVEA